MSQRGIVQSPYTIESTGNHKKYNMLAIEKLKHKFLSVPPGLLSPDLGYTESIWGTKFIVSSVNMELRIWFNNTS
jgi:hypothetical protein